MHAIGIGVYLAITWIAVAVGVAGQALRLTGGAELIGANDLAAATALRSHELGEMRRLMRGRFGRGREVKA